jgi:hypothetical protein
MGVRRFVAALVVSVSVAGVLTGCSVGSFCQPLTPTPRVKAEFRSTVTAVAAVPGVVSLSARYYQPSDSHCVSRDYLKTAPWAADITIRVLAGFDRAQVVALRDALGTSTGSAAACTNDRPSASEIVPEPCVDPPG